MIQNFIYKTPQGFSNILISVDDGCVVGLRFTDDAHTNVPTAPLAPILRETIKWLNAYFGGNIPEWTPNYMLKGMTLFRQATIDAIKQIPFGKTTSYKEIAHKIARQIGVSNVSARAVGGAVGRNPICIIIPCHRVIGATGTITGYNGGIQNKIALLEHEQTILKKNHIKIN
ncbi:MAG: methylated-DNA--[Alphaproteobacteria bacterium]|nr:methylated-DNA--[protein]-cysteine S-methyltransferase [Alphaproteobacteria bacterium]